MPPRTNSIRCHLETLHVKAFVAGGGQQTLYKVNQCMIALNFEN